MNAFYPESRFGGFTGIDGTIAFFNRVNALLAPSSVVLDFGCGPGAYGDDPIPYRRNLRILKGKVDKVIGVDVDAQAGANPFIDEFRLIDNGRLPVGDGAIDLVLANFVVEHLPDPAAFFAECARVLKTGGYLCIRTSNSWSYVAILSRLIPQKLHRSLLSKVQEGRKEEDVYPACYRCNTTWRIRSLLKKSNFEYVVYGHEPEPGYLSFSKICYWLGAVYGRVVPSFMRASVIAFARLK